jgi:hypothetical protein
MKAHLHCFHLPQVHVDISFSGQSTELYWTKRNKIFVDEREILQRNGLICSQSRQSVSLLFVSPRSFPCFREYNRCRWVSTSKRTVYREVRSLRNCILDGQSCKKSRCSVGCKQIAVSECTIRVRERSCPTSRYQCRVITPYKR